MAGNPAGFTPMTEVFCDKRHASWALTFVVACAGSSSLLGSWPCCQPHRTWLLFKPKDPWQILRTLFRHLCKAAHSKSGCIRILLCKGKKLFAHLVPDWLFWAAAYDCASGAAGMCLTIGVGIAQSYVCAQEHVQDMLISHIPYGSCVSAALTS